MIISLNLFHFQLLLHTFLLMLQLLTNVSLSITLILLALLVGATFVILLTDLSLMPTQRCHVLPALAFLTQIMVLLFFFNLELISNFNYFNFINYLVLQFIKLNLIFTDWHFMHFCSFTQNLCQDSHHSSHWLKLHSFGWFHSKIFVIPREQTKSFLHFISFFTNLLCARS